MGDIEYGPCDICKKNTPLTRKYYRYDLKCNCCNRAEDNHFEIVRFCANCQPKPPLTVKAYLDPLEDPT